MPFVAKHVRLTNSGKIPELFLTAKVQAPANLADAKLGKLFFVLQIDNAWSHGSPIGSSIINIISREYYRQEGHVPLENFERAIAKANRLLEQLIKDGDTQLAEAFHALVALAVGDEIHIAYAGAAEAYFWRDQKLNLVTEPGIQKGQPKQLFNNLITGEVSANDIILLGSPGLYENLTTDELELTLNQPYPDSATMIARRLKSIRARKVNAILLQFNTVQAVENSILKQDRDTIYLDQRIDSTWSIITYTVQKITTPLLHGLNWIGKHLGVTSQKTSRRTKQLWQEKIQPTTQSLVSQTSEKLHQTSPRLRLVAQRFKQLKPSLPKLDKLAHPIADAAETIESGVPVNYYSNRRRRQSLAALTIFSMPVKATLDITKQFRRAFRRSPRTWYIVAALLILASIGASIQTRKNQLGDQPVITAATIDEIKDMLNDAKQARAQGNNNQARGIYIEAIDKATATRQNKKLEEQATALLTAAEKELLSLSGATQLTAITPILTLPNETRIGAIHEGVLYYATNDGQINSLLLTGGEPTSLATLPDSQAVNQLYLDTKARRLYIQSYTGKLYQHTLGSKTLQEIKTDEGEFPIATGLNTFGENFYLLDPANNQIWRYTPDGTNFGEATAYIKGKAPNLSDSLGLAIDGSILVLTKEAKVYKFSRGNQAEFQLTGLPVPYNIVDKPIQFFASEDADRYYLADQGNDKIAARIIEFDKTGKFVHQYFLPKQWQNDIKLVLTNPKSHKAWVLVNKELYEFTLVQ